MSRAWRRVLAIAALLGAAALALPAQAAPCASPLEPGPWSGGLAWSRNVIHPMVTVQITDAGILGIEVACDGTIASGAGAGSFVMKAVVTVAGLPGDGECMRTWAATVQGGKVEQGTAGLPLITLNLQLAHTSRSCKGFHSILAPLFDADLAPGPYTFRLRANAQEPNKVSGDNPWIEEGPLNDSVDKLKGMGAVVVDGFTWALEKGKKEIPPVPVDEKKPPIITAISPPLEGVYLEKVEKVGLYTLTLDWLGQPPGTVDVAIGDNTTFGTTAGNTVTAEIPIDQLDAGSHVVTLLAKSAGGDSTQVRTVQIVPVPKWAEPFALKATVDPARVNYAGNTQIAYPFPALMNVPSSVPILGGPLGLQFNGFNAGLAAVSTGGAQTRPVTGTINVFISVPSAATLPIEPPSATTATLTATGLQFNSGTVMPRPSMPVSRSLPANVVVPQLLDVPAGMPVPVTYSITTQGQIDLGVANDAIGVTGGKLTLTIDAQVLPIDMTTGSGGTLRVAGSGKAVLEISFGPTPTLANCVVTGSVTVLNVTPDKLNATPPVQGGAHAVCN